MKKIDTTGHDNNRWSAGDPSQGISATKFSAQYMNSIQDELVNVIESAGLTIAQGASASAETTDNQQLYKAIIAIAKLNGGGGGGGATWVSPAGEAPEQVEEHGQDVFKFAPGAGQKLYLTIPVPSNFTEGSRMYLDFQCYSPSVAGDILLKTRNYLIRLDTDGVDDRTNVHNSTVAAKTNSATANALRKFTCDLCDSSSQVNSIVPSQGDLLVIELFRGSDTDTDEVRFIPSTTVVRIA